MHHDEKLTWFLISLMTIWTIGFCISLAFAPVVPLVVKIIAPPILLGSCGIAIWQLVKK